MNHAFLGPITLYLGLQKVTQTQENRAKNTRRTRLCIRSHDGSLGLSLPLPLTHPPFSSPQHNHPPHSHLVLPHCHLSPEAAAAKRPTFPVVKSELEVLLLPPLLPAKSKHDGECESRGKNSHAISQLLTHTHTHYTHTGARERGVRGGLWQHRRDCPSKVPG